MSSINGIDPIIVNAIKVQTQKPIITETQKTKISDNKKDNDKRKENSKHLLQSLIDAVDKLNKRLEQNKIPLYFQIVRENAELRVQLINSENQDIIAVISPERVFRMVEEFNTRGFTIDELI